MRMPTSMSPARPSHMLPLCILPPSHAKLALAGGRLDTGRPLGETEQTLTGSSITYVSTCREGHNFWVEGHAGGHKHARIRSAAYMWEEIRWWPRGSLELVMEHICYSESGIDGHGAPP